MSWSLPTPSFSELFTAFTSSTIGWITFCSSFEADRGILSSNLGCRAIGFDSKGIDFCFCSSGFDWRTIGSVDFGWIAIDSACFGFGSAGFGWRAIGSTGFGFGSTGFGWRAIDSTGFGFGSAGFGWRAIGSTGFGFGSAGFGWRAIDSTGLGFNSIGIDFCSTGFGSFDIGFEFAPIKFCFNSSALFICFMFESLSFPFWLISFLTFASSNTKIYY